LSGATIPRAIVSRRSAAVLPEAPARRAGRAAALPAWRERRCAVCWRPRPFPPFRAADFVREELEDDRLELDFAEDDRLELDLALGLRADDRPLVPPLRLRFCDLPDVSAISLPFQLLR
jgi:hypothetical protein